MHERICLPDEVAYILHKLHDNGFEGYIVGGCVRDSLLKKTPDDWDITTSAQPDQIKRLFAKTIDTGLRHGTVTVIIAGRPYEITTYRIDGTYADYRRPEMVSYTSSLKEDLSRRDFTVNAMAYNHKTGLVDYFNGVHDLQRTVIHAVGDPDVRFQEDALRMMRAVRFACQLHFSVGANTFNAISRNHQLIGKISAERIRDELCKILLSDQPSVGIEMLRAASLLNIILPELMVCVNFGHKNPHHHKNVYDHTLLVLDAAPKKLVVRLAALLHDIGKPATCCEDENGIRHFYGHHIESEEIARGILTRFRFDRQTVYNVSKLVREHMNRYHSLNTAGLKRFINRIGTENLQNFFELQIADTKGSKPPHDFSAVYELNNRVQKILQEKQPLSVKDLAVNGYDLMKIGIEPGVQMGRILNGLLARVLAEPEMNTKENLLKIILDERQADFFF